MRIGVGESDGRSWGQWIGEIDAAGDCRWSNSAHVGACGIWGRIEWRGRTAAGVDRVGGARFSLLRGPHGAAKYRIYGAIARTRRRSSVRGGIGEIRTRGFWGAPGEDVFEGATPTAVDCEGTRAGTALGGIRRADGWIGRCGKRCPSASGERGGRTRGRRRGRDA